jgi:SAM-dependent methyltransferase
MSAPNTMDPSKKARVKRHLLNPFLKHTQRDVNLFRWRIDTPYVARWLQGLYDLIFQVRPTSVLDIGCGEGLSLHYSTPPRYVGVDTSFERLRQAAFHYKLHSFVQGDGTSLPFSSERFDLVFCKGTLHHLPKHEIFPMMREMQRVCRKGGWVAFIEPNAFNLSFFILALLRRRERGILNCRTKIFLNHFERLGMHSEILLKYEGAVTPLRVITLLLRNREFVKSPWFTGLCRTIDGFSNKVIPERFWTNIVILAKKE